MSTESEMRELIGRLMAEPDFRAAVAASPESTLEAAGYLLTKEQLAGIKAADLGGYSESLDQRLSKCFELWPF